MKDKSKDSRVIFIRLTVILILAAIFAVVANAESLRLEISRTTISVVNLPEGLDGLRIAQVSDLHSSRYGNGQIELIDAIKDFKPDLIAVTGDFIDGVDPDSAPCAELVRGLAPVAPVYMIRGNHEYYLDDTSLAAFDKEIQSCGAELLVNRAVALERNGLGFLIAGMDDVARFMDDPRAAAIGREQYAMKVAAGFIAEIRKSEPAGGYPLKIMLCHQPPYWQLWRDAGYDAALCGHLHGWVARAPGIGGMLRKPSMYFPEEDAGLYDKQGIMVYISRGLDNLKRLNNFRMNNRPELALIEIKLHIN